MEDLFYREQQILDNAVKRLNEIKNGALYSDAEYIALVNEYGKLLRQLRRVTKISDRTTVNLNSSKLDLLDKVHYDALTGIYNRRFMEENLKRVMKSLSRSGGMLSICMVDIDFFKKYNDTLGHSAGDNCLRTVAKVLSGTVSRADDFVARYGGEEFAVVLPNTDEKGARNIAGKMLANIRECNIPHKGSEVSERITISVGAAAGRVKHTQSSSDYIDQADKALYAAKQNGRDNYIFFNIGDEFP